MQDLKHAKTKESERMQAESDAKRVASVEPQTRSSLKVDKVFMQSCFNHVY